MTTPSGCWDVSRLVGLLPAEIISKVVVTCPPRADFGSNRPGWRWEESRVFSIRSAYKAIRVFLLLAVHNRPLTNKERHRRHLVDSSCCPFCTHNEEDLSHVLRHCGKATQVWSTLIKPNMFHEFMAKPLDVWLEENLRGNNSVAFHDGNWNVLFAVIVWKLWKQRCSLIFEPSFVERGDFLSHCMSFKNEIIQTRNNQELCSIAPDQMLHWQRPSSGWVRVNVDGAVSGPNQCATVGGVVRDEYAAWLFGFARSLGSCSVIMAELWATHDGLLHAWRLGYRKVELESDSRQVVDILKCDSLDLIDSAVVTLVHELLRRQWEVRIRHVRREANSVADKLAKLMRGQPRSETLYVDPPAEVSEAFLQDQLV
ncbi:hypothetical protein GQ457_03G010450 [Hibiscus cannabinus]